MPVGADAAAVEQFGTFPHRHDVEARLFPHGAHAGPQTGDLDADGPVGRSVQMQCGPSAQVRADQGAIDISCQFCNQEYRFDPIDVEQLLRGGSGGSRQLH